MQSSLISGFDIAEDAVRRRVGEALSGADDGELFVEYRESEMLGFDNGRLKAGSFNTASGFGLRSVAGEAVGYAQSDDFSEAALIRAADAVRAVSSGHTGTYAEAPARTNKKLYGDENPIGTPSFVHW